MACVAGLMSVSASAVDAQEFEAIPAADGFDPVFEARWRNLDGSADNAQMYLGVPTIDPPPREAEGFGPNLPVPAVEVPFSFEYGTGEGTFIFQSIGAGEFVGGSNDYETAGLDPFEDLLFLIRTGNGQALSLDNVTIFYPDESSVNLGTISASGNGNFFFIVDNAVSGSFFIEGTYSFSLDEGVTVANESPRFEIRGGGYTPPPPQADIPSCEQGDLLGVDFECPENADDFIITVADPDSPNFVSESCSCFSTPAAAGFEECDPALPAGATGSCIDAVNPDRTAPETVIYFGGGGSSFCIKSSNPLLCYKRR